jgi:SAM-dependent methyltransferase
VTSAHERHNRAFWDADADDYQAAHGAELAGAPLAWGAFRASEAELRVLGAPGDLAGLAVLEFGCGGGQWAVALSGLGARVTGLDVSRGQLRHAQKNAGAAGAAVALVCASGEAAPFAPSSFDVVFCDHGAMSFCDPQRTVPEVARLLRPGGVFAFCAATPLVYLTYDEVRDRQTRELKRPYTELGRMAFGDGTVDFVLPPGDWLRLFRANGFAVEDLIELVAPSDATTTYTDFVPKRWATRWPAEQIWKLRKERGGD